MLLWVMVESSGIGDLLKFIQVYLDPKIKLQPDNSGGGSSTSVVAVGSASSRSTGIGLPETSL
jgi:hypothetical protein